MSESLKRARKKQKESPFLTPAEQVKKMKEERAAYFKGLQEIEELKRKFYEDEELPEKIPNKEMVKVEEELQALESIIDVHPGRKIFIDDKRYQLFNADYLSEKLHYEMSFKTVRCFLADKILLLPNVNSSLCHTLFFLMAVDKDYFVSESCSRFLKNNITVWVPRIRHILCVLMNWGATLETLRLTISEKQRIFGDDDPEIVERKVHLEDRSFEDFNYVNVISYLITVLKSKIYPLEEILILLKVMIAITLEKISLLTQIRILIDVAVNSLEDWNNFKVVTFSRYIYDDTEHYHNQIFIATTVIPNFSKCREISSCLSFEIMRAMIKGKVNFCYPNEDEDFLDLVKGMAESTESQKDLYKYYLLIQMINFIVCQRLLEYTNSEALISLHDILDSFKVNLVRKNKGLDAELVKGRINYCVAMWGLFQLEKKSEEQHFLLSQ